MRSPGPVFDLRAALTKELRTAIDELDASSDKPKAVHRCRVHLKRARALAHVGRACAPGLAAVFNDTARGVARTLGRASDAAALTKVARRAAKNAPGKTAKALATIIERLKAESSDAAPLNMEAARAGLKDLLALAQVWPEASHRQIRRGAQRIARRARRARRRALEAADTARRHAWRKREKDRLFAALLLDDAWPGARRKGLSKALGKALGKEHDVALLIQRVSADPGLAGGSEAAERALERLRRRRARLSRRGDALGRRLHSGGV